MNLPQAFLQRMEERLPSLTYKAFLDSYDKPAARAIRVNTLKIGVEEYKKISPFAASPVPWAQDGFYVTQKNAGGFIHHFAGLYYVQEPSAMVAAPMLNVNAGEAVLDLCSAPGGKGTQLAQAMQGNGILFLNEINFSRAKILSQNVERLGVRNAVVTVASPQQLAEQFPACFDKILVDAPCSGEGMFKKEEAAIREWSAANVAMCAKRQGEILECADRLLKAGGKLVYSTCTFSEEEDEWQIQNFLSAHPEYILLEQKKLYPHEVKGEGHYAALLQKTDGNARSFGYIQGLTNKQYKKIYRDFESAFLNEEFSNLYLSGETLYAYPDRMPQVNAQVLRAGVRLGEVTGSRFTPSHSLAMCLKNMDGVELSQGQAQDYLKGLQVSCPVTSTGWKVATFSGYPLGWVKCSGGAAKNHFPKALRVPPNFFKS